jgi:hypothetical protein
MSVVVYDWIIDLLLIRPIPRTAPLVVQVMTLFAILYSYMTPISLCVTKEFVRFFQRWTFATDLCMRDPELGQCQTNNSDPHKERGHFEHIFSDETG